MIDVARADPLDAAAEAFRRRYKADADRLAVCVALAEFGVFSNRHLEAITGLGWYRVSQITKKRDHSGGRLAVHTLPLMQRLRADWAEGHRNGDLLRVILAEGTSQGMVAKLCGIHIKTVERWAAR